MPNTMAMAAAAGAVCKLFALAELEERLLLLERETRHDNAG